VAVKQRAMALAALCVVGGFFRWNAVDGSAMGADDLRHGFLQSWGSIKVSGTYGDMSGAQP
jgi:hypothetical protein